MKTKALIFCLALIFTAPAFGQSVDKILNTFFENTGGIDKWKSLKGTRMNAKINQGGMEMPVEIVQLADGRGYTKIELQGNVIMQGVYDGKTAWSTNFQTMKAEKADAEMTEMTKLNANDFPDPFIDYKKKGYKVELMGKETVEGAECFKIKLTKEPVTINGEKVPDVSYYFFDTENYVPIAMESEVKMGPQKGVIAYTTLSDYQEVDGLYFAFSTKQGIKDGPTQPITIESIELNPKIEDSVFAFPAQ